MRRADTGRLRSLLLNQPEPILLLGAGASITSGIPAVRETVEKAARWAWCKERGRHPEDLTVRRSDYWPWLTEKPWFSDENSLEDQYPKVIDELLGVKSDRREFFERLISPGIPPNKGYRSLARILSQGWISTILTTNFDRCLEQAALLENKPHHIVIIKTADDLVRFSAAPSIAQLLYLHGSVEHYSDKNLESEILTLSPAIVERVWPLLRDHPIIVVGYRGCEPSVMNGLFLDQISKTNCFAQGVYWCVLEKEVDAPPPPMVKALATAIGTNFVRVPIAGFDDLFQYELWDRLVADGAQPTRRNRGYAPLDLPPDMQPQKDLRCTEFDRNLLFSRLCQYASKTAIKVPDAFDQAWVDQMSERLDLTAAASDAVVPTLAGWLLFARNPTPKRPNAVVHFKAEGPESWLRTCFGVDADLTETDHDDILCVDREIGGNLWSQFDKLMDLLALVNPRFLLKEEVSRPARAYNSLAIREMIVNALAHRDYRTDAPVTVEVTPERIAVSSPGGLVPEVAAQMAGQPLEALIKSGRRQIKGYRNPAISDLLYGGGQMERRGSGLSDMWKETVNNNGRIEFGPNVDNSSFVVTIWSRPEAVDVVTNTAVSSAIETNRFAGNLVPIETLPDVIWHAGVTTRSAWELKKDAGDLAVPPGYVQDGRFFTFYNLEKLADSLVSPFDSGDIETLTVGELIALPNGGNILLKLIHEAIFEHLRYLGMRIDDKRRRAYFPKGDEPERKITYQGRVRRATRTIVKARMRRDSNDVLYYEHKAMMFSVMPFDDQWAVILTPGYTFTRDGGGKPIGRERTNSLSTRRAARDFNPSVHHDVIFWLAVLSEEAEGLFALKCEPQNDLALFAPAILLSSRLPTVSYSSTAFNDFADIEGEIDIDLAELEAELADLATEPDEDDESVSEQNNGN